MKGWWQVAQSFCFLDKAPYTELSTFPAKAWFGKQFSVLPPVFELADVSLRTKGDPYRPVPY